MLKRRDFGKVVAGGVIGAGLGSGASEGAIVAAKAHAPRKNMLMHVGGDYHSVAGGRGAGMTEKANLEYNLRHNVKSLTVQMEHVGDDGSWELDELKRMRDNCDKAGMNLEAIRMDSGYIVLRKGAERERRLAAIQDNIRKAGQVGVKVITNHWWVIPIRRNTQAPGRGGSTYAAFKLEDNWKELPIGKSGRVDSDDYWERITTFLQAVIPVCKEHDVRMANHPYDPPGLPFGYQGVDSWDSPSLFDGLKRYESVVDSPYNGFQLCLGTCGEGLKKPKTDIMPIVQYLADRGKIYQVHMRNIRGGFLNTSDARFNFAEVYPDEGEIDFVGVMRILRDSQYQHAILPDHMPSHPDDPGKLQAYAFGYGYIQALIQAVNAEV
jgi:mannonate dehydratase